MQSNEQRSVFPILVIDDNPENLRVVVDVLESDGHTVRTARSGDLGLQRAASIAPALILLDVEMPEMDGYETCRRLKADPALREIPVVFMTARSEVADKVRAFEVGAVDYVTKPFEVHEVLARVRTHLQLRALQDELQQRNRQLEELNATLQDRVEEQVSELVRRAQEIETLNAHLREQVRDRSEALSLTLTRLARRSKSHDDLVGVVLDDRYVIQQLIGIGGMGAVYSGTDERTGEKIAIKLIRSSNPRGESMQRFIREARVAAAVDHPGIVRMLHIDVHDDGQLFQVQELVEGETLSICLRRHGEFGEGQGGRLMCTLADALHAAHIAGVCHRDLKPSNILLTKKPPGLKVVDFGIAKRQPEITESSPELARIEGPTVQGEVLGTPRFMSPEQKAGSEIGSPTDVYTMGILAYLVWTRGVPSEDSELLLPHFASEAIRASLSEEPADRPTAKEFADVFERLAELHHAPPLHEIVATAKFK